MAVSGRSGSPPPRPLRPTHGAVVTPLLVGVMDGVEDDRRCFEFPVRGGTENESPCEVVLAQLACRVSPQLQSCLHFLSVYFFSIDPQKFIDGSTSSPGCSVINENPGLFKFWVDPVKPWITIKGPKAAIWS